MLDISEYGRLNIKYDYPNPEYDGVENECEIRFVRNIKDSLKNSEDYCEKFYITIVGDEYPEELDAILPHNNNGKYLNEDDVAKIVNKLMDAGAELWYTESYEEMYADAIDNLGMEPVRKQRDAEYQKNETQRIMEQVLPQLPDKLSLKLVPSEDVANDMIEKIVCKDNNTSVTFHNEGNGKWSFKVPNWYADKERVGTTEYWDWKTLVQEWLTEIGRGWGISATAYFFTDEDMYDFIMMYSLNYGNLIKQFKIN